MGQHGAHLGPEADSVLGDVAPVLVMAQVAVGGGHLDGSVDAVCQAVNGPGVHADRAAHRRRAPHKLRHHQHRVLLCRVHILHVLTPDTFSSPFQVTVSQQQRWLQ